MCSVRKAMPGCSMTVLSYIQAEIIACKHRENAVECGIPPLPNKCRKTKNRINLYPWIWIV